MNKKGTQRLSHNTSLLSMKFPLSALVLLVASGCSQFQPLQRQATQAVVGTERDDHDVGLLADHGLGDP